jgi:CubicO group peptidase (beta-lactamase class C family)
MKISLTLLLLTTLHFSTLHSQPAPEILDKALDRIYRKSNLPGFAVAIIKGEEIWLSKGYGYANLKTKATFTTETIMPVGSVSKTFIGMALMKGVALGHFSLNTPINEVLPFRVTNPHRPQDTIRIWHLATHTSGIIDRDSAYWKTYQLGTKPTISLRDFLYAYFTPTGSQYRVHNFDSLAPGTRFNYSNIGSALAALIIENTTSVTFDEFSKVQIIEPLGLKNTHWFYLPEKDKSYATLYDVNTPEELYKPFLNSDKSLKPYTSITYPDGSLKTNVDDLSGYIIELIKAHDGKSHILDQAMCSTLFKAQFTSDNMPENMLASEPNRAIFWAYNRKGRLTHTGSDPGVFAAISIDLEKKIGRILLTNTSIDSQNNEKTVSSIKEIISFLDSVD